MQIDVQVFGTRAVTDVVVTGDARGTIAAVNPAHATEVAARLGDETPAAIRDRCYSLVQSIADGPNCSTTAADYIDTIQGEACQIAKDAGWVK